MTSQSLLNSQLKRLSLRFRIFGRAEVQELRRVLDANEHIHECTFGYYEGGSGLLVITDNRVLLIDKQPFFLNIEDVRYEDIDDISLSNSWLQATLRLQTRSTTITFRSLSDARLRRVQFFVTRNIWLAQQQTEQAQKPLEQNIDSHVGRPYLHPSWRPHNTTLLTRRKPTKFYPLSSTVTLSQD